MVRNTILIAMALAALPAVAQGQPYYNSLKKLGSICKVAVSVMDAIDSNTSRRLTRGNAKDWGTCGGYLMGIKNGLTVGGDNRDAPLRKAYNCLNKVRVSESQLVRAFAHYYSNQEITGQGQQTINALENSPSLYTTRALLVIYGCNPDKNE